MKVLILACLLVAVFAEPAVYFREKFEGIYAILLQKYDAETGVCAGHFRNGYSKLINALKYDR